MNGWMDAGWMYCIQGWIDEGLDGWMHGWMYCMQG